MPNVFSPRFDTVFRAVFFSGVGTLLGALGLLLVWPWTDYSTGANFVVNQPVPFSHAHHVSGLGIDCRYCHTSVEEGAYAGMPPTSTCLNCHQQLWTEAELLEPVRWSRRENRSIPWNRVHDVPDHAYFNHAVHVNNGVGCVECHGRVDRMPLIRQEASLTMSWCLDCHRDPGRRLRPPEAIYDFEWSPPKGREAELARELMDMYKIEPVGLTHCTACHR